MSGLKVFFLIFLPIMFVITSLSYFYYTSINNANIQALKDNEKFRISLQGEAFREECRDVVSDLIVLSSHIELSVLINKNNDDNLGALEYEYLIFAQSKDIYDQVRLLKADGMEVVRVNFNEGKPELVPRKELQFKGGRYYFKDTIKLKRGEIFVSPFDLNTEGGEIEQPLKPTIRFGMPIFDKNEEVWGMIVLNYLGSKLLEKIEKAAHQAKSKGYNLLINSDGYFLKGVANNDEWGFMFPERKNKTFKNMFNNSWDAINAVSSGQLYVEQGLLTFDTLYPLTEGLKSSSGSNEVFGESVKALDANKYYWKLASFIPEDRVYGLTAYLRSVLIVFNLLFITILGVFAWLLSRAIIQHRLDEAKIKRLAHFDDLTGLPNRSLLYDHMELYLAAAKREEVPLYVFFIDLDGFKKVNDQLGHKAGDHILIEVGKRLKKCVRQMDTIARLGGDEFVLVIKSEKKIEKIHKIAQRVVTTLSEPIMFNSHSCQIGSSIGIATYPKDGTTSDALMTKADTIMYEVKNSGKNNYRFSE